MKLRTAARITGVVVAVFALVAIFAGNTLRFYHHHNINTQHAASEIEIPSPQAIALPDGWEEWTSSQYCAARYVVEKKNDRQEAVAVVKYLIWHADRRQWVARCYKGEMVLVDGGWEKMPQPSLSSPDEMRIISGQIQERFHIPYRKFKTK